jgi:hypothetical protein
LNEKQGSVLVHRLLFVQVSIDKGQNYNAKAILKTNIKIKMNLVLVLLLETCVLVDPHLLDNNHPISINLIQLQLLDVQNVGVV